MVHIAKGSGERRVEIPASDAKYVATYIVTHTSGIETELTVLFIMLTLLVRILMHMAVKY